MGLDIIDKRQSRKSSYFIMPLFPYGIVNECNGIKTLYYATLYSRAGTYVFSKCVLARSTSNSSILRTGGKIAGEFSLHRIDIGLYCGMLCHGFCTCRVHVSLMLLALCGLIHSPTAQRGKDSEVRCCDCIPAQELASIFCKDLCDAFVLLVHPFHEHLEFLLRKGLWLEHGHIAHVLPRIVPIFHGSVHRKCSHCIRRIVPVLLPQETHNGLALMQHLAINL
mmetsp:Transcript_5757/g.6613  ORF Transcript_5757/g.6613 Transcript_5757/m.6613 type:complete len:223 (-) Transcript_5757:290-958(-)